jgi:hypothetical protein
MSIIILYWPKRIFISQENFHKNILFFFVMYCLTAIVMLVLERKELADFQSFNTNNGQTANTFDIKETKIHTTC